MSVPDNNGNIVKRTSQYIDNIEHDDTTGGKAVSIVGTPDGVNRYRLAINADGSIGTANSTVTERYDIEGTTIYTATAPVGTSDSSTGWTITKYDLSNMTAASGKISTDVSWSDRVTGTYA